MGKVILRDGRILDLSAEQHQNLSMVVLLTNDMKKNVKVGSEQFSLNDIVTGQDEITRILQQRLLDVPTIAVDKKRKRQELA